MRRQPLSKNEPIIIVGAGVFGLSIALELSKRGYSSVTVLDRYLPPVPDGSSVDISRVIRVEYADPVYSKMAIESRDGWRGKYQEHYHESGFVLLFQDKHEYAQKSLETGESLGEKLTEHDSVATLVDEFPGGFQSNAPGMKGLTNRSGGWANAAGAIRQLASECTAAGVSFITGSRGRVVSLRRNGNKIVGVNVAAGDAIPASQVILSAGAWSNTLIHMTHASTASGQPVGFVQLTPSEAKRLEKMPVILNLVTGVFVFPPTPNSHILKIARHGHGFATEREARNAIISAPKSDGNNAKTGFIPDDADTALRNGLRQLVPEFGERPWINRRLCWYSDTPEGDFIIDHHPKLDGLFLATGGAGHAFKFLPVLGRYISDCFEDVASEALRCKWRFRLPSTSGDGAKPGDGSRGGPPLRVLSKAEQAKL